MLSHRLSRHGMCCARAGFFYIENHGVPQELIDRAFSSFSKCVCALVSGDPCRPWLRPFHFIL